MATGKQTDELAEELIETLFDAYPVAATVLGIRGRDDRLTDYTHAGDAATVARARGIAERASAIDPGGLTADEGATRAVVIQQCEAIADQLGTGSVEYTVTDYFEAPVAGMMAMFPMIRIGDREQADAYLARLAKVPDMLGDVAHRHRAGIAAQRLPVRHQVQAAIAHLDRYLSDPDNDPLRTPQPPEDADTKSFAPERDRLLEDVIRPAIRRYRDVLATEIESHGRPADRAGVCWLPDGDSIYSAMVRVHTTTARSPEELHQTGRDLIAQLAEEYVEIGAEAFGTRDLEEIRNRLKTDPALRWKDGDELLTAARTAIARAEEAAPRWFGRLPQQRCTVEAVPAVEAPGAPAAYYMQPALDGSRPGIYFANTHKADERDRYTSETTAFHEAVPGHHFQLTIAQELTDLPLLRRLAPVNAYSEGWGLYAERLADEMGLFSDAIARLGMLAADSVRAARLVVDTGLHAKGWSRQRAVDYMAANTVLPQVEIETETDRYIADPGQALAYMVGRLEIQRLRSDAERAMGTRFDIRAFHDTVLGSGPLPISVLGQVVGAWAGFQA